MTTIIKSMFFTPTAAFAWFAILLAARDISAEIFLSEDAISLAFAICATIVALSFAMIVFTGTGKDLLEKLTKPGVLWRAVVLGSVSGAIYGGIFYLIKHMGVGLFAMIDYGLVPLATVGVGVLFFKEKIKPELAVAFAIFLLGIVFLFAHREMFGGNLLFFALFCPIATAASDGLTKWLLNPERGNLTRPQLLVVRFAPAAIFLFIFATYSNDNGLIINNLPRTLLVSVFFGWLPLWLLCTGLCRQGLSKLALFEFLIPGIAFFGTLHLHPETNARPLPIFGGALVLVAIIVSQVKIFNTKAKEPVEQKPGNQSAAA